MFFVIALVSILRTEIGCGVKIRWLPAVFCLPFPGGLRWFAMGRPADRR
ncbi:PLDc N-terminal domain-containing protein [Amycolatopsis minnesotensis]|uniref:Cardiolipin synthase N-terminal domain-containing protein n=1 Tax=Amycolatopsis minnesotensis TaxID=337894 RepID=A0ABN2QE71_9PSEU